MCRGFMWLGIVLSACANAPTDGGAEDETGDAAVCGNGRVEGSETCDDADAVLGNGCNPDCQLSGRLVTTVVVPNRLDAAAFDVGWSGESEVFAIGWANASQSPVTRDAWASVWVEGRTQWSRTFERPAAVALQHGEAVAVDAEGPVVVGCDDRGVGQRTLWIERLDATGATVWREEDEPRAWLDVPNARIVVTASGVAVGGSVVEDDAWQWHVTRYGPDGGVVEHTETSAAGRLTDLAHLGGDVLMTVGVDAFGGADLRRYAPGEDPELLGQGLDWIANAIAPTDDGFVLAGRTAGSEGADLIVSRRLVDGAPVWTREYDGDANLDDAALDVAVDEVGTVVVTGSSQRTASRSDLVALKFSADGDLWWSYRHEAPSSAGTAVALAPDGHVAVAGSVRSDDDTTDAAAVLVLAP